MKTELHPANQRGHAHHGWLNTFHSFSFAAYFNPAREQFGCLRVLNDDTIAGGSGFDMHPHNNMEIITIVLEGTCAHRDSMGHTQAIHAGEVQVMSAGTGIYHAEYNHSPTHDLKLFQIWIFPRGKNLPSRYDQKNYNWQSTQNQLITLVTPDTEKEPDRLWIQQDAYLSVINLDKNNPFEYQIKQKGNGVFAMVIEGEISVANNHLGKRDAIALSETERFSLKTIEKSSVLFIETPMK